MRLYLAIIYTFLLNTSAFSFTDTISKPVIVFKLGYDTFGAPTPEWRKIIMLRTTNCILANNHTNSISDQEWTKKLLGKKQKWSELIPSLKSSFRSLPIPDTLYILLGNQCGDDAFSMDGNTICFDISQLTKQYGNANDSINNARADRLFAHEYTHILHTAWLKQNPVRLNTPFERALWECWYEGLGHYRSLSEKWLPQNNTSPPITLEVMNQLTPLFISRMNSLYLSKGEDEDSLRKGLSTGRIDTKWGAFTVAIWIALETNGDPKKLNKLIEKGPQSVIYLAKKNTTEVSSKKLLFLKYR